MLEINEDAGKNFFCFWFDYKLAKQVLRSNSTFDAFCIAEAEECSSMKSEEFAEKIAKIAMRYVQSSNLFKQSTSSSLVKESLKSSNLLEFCEEHPNFDILSEKETTIIRYHSCDNFFTNFGTSLRNPADTGTGTLSLVLQIDEETFEQLKQWICDKWFQQKSKITSARFNRHPHNKPH